MSNTRKLFETEHLAIYGAIYRVLASGADIVFKCADATEVIIGTYYLRKLKEPVVDTCDQENGLNGQIVLYGDKFAKYICDFERYGEFIRCLDEFNDIVLNRLNGGANT